MSGSYSRGQVRSGAKGTSVPADVTSTPTDANHEALDVAVQSIGGSGGGLDEYAFPAFGTPLYLAVSTVNANVSVPAGNYVLMSTIEVAFKDGGEPTLNQDKLLPAKILVSCRWTATTTVHFKTAAGTGVVYLWPCT